MTSAKLIFNPKALKPAQRVTRATARDAACPVDQVPGAAHITMEVLAAHTRAAEREGYWRGFADGAREAQAMAPHVPWTETEIQAYYARTKGF